MVKISQQRRNRACSHISFIQRLVCGLLLMPVLFLPVYFVSKENIQRITLSLSPFSKHNTKSELFDIVDDKCRNLPFVRPGGNIFFDSKVHDVTSLEGIEPSFHFGSLMGQKARYHMETDKNHFSLIRELLAGKEGGLAFDMGANQGFYTYYLATLGMKVHSFEIFESNFNALQHGIYFNPPLVGKNVHVYPIGLGQKTGKMNMQGSNYDGFLKDEGKDEGNIQGLTFDCFAYHHPELDLNNVDFVKLDVEGFEIAVLKGTHNSLFKGDEKNVRGMIMEVGPNRWSRASISFAEGAMEMKKLASHFNTNSVILRKEGAGHFKTCPEPILSKFLSDKSPRVLGTDSVHRLKANELEPLLAVMDKESYDCNFWYTR